MTEGAVLGRKAGEVFISMEEGRLPKTAVRHFRVTGHCHITPR